MIHLLFVMPKKTVDDFHTIPVMSLSVSKAKCNDRLHVLSFSTNLFTVIAVKEYFTKLYINP